MYIPTKELIRAALYRILQEKSMDQITVKIICQRAGLSRQAFYNHYYAISDAVSDMLHDRLIAKLSKIGEDAGWDIYFDFFLRELRREKELVRNIYDSSFQKDLLDVLGRFADGCVQKEIAVCLQKYPELAPKEDRKFLEILYKTLIMGLLDQLLESNMSPEVETTIRRCMALLTGTLQGGFEKARQLEGEKGKEKT